MVARTSVRRTAKAELEAETGRRIFDIVVMDVANLGSVRAGLAAIDGTVDALVNERWCHWPAIDGLDR